MQSLADLCVSTIAQNVLDIETCKIIEALEDEQLEAFEKLLPADLPADIALTLNLDEDYWQQRCEKKWDSFNMWSYKSSWKTLYVQRSVQELIDSVDTNFNISDFMNTLAAFKNYVFELDIKGLPFISIQDCADVPSVSLGRYAGKLILLFTKVQKIRLNIIPQNCGLSFDLEKFVLTDSDYDYLFQSLLQIKSLNSFAFICPGITPCRILQLTESLLTLDNLTELNLSCNMITDDSAESIEKLLTLGSLQTLILSNNNIGNDGAMKFSNSLGGNISLRFLDLSRNCIGNSGATCVFEKLMENSTLIKLDMKENLFGEDAGRTFIKLLEHTSSIKYFNISGNKLQEAMGKMIAESITKNKKILFLDLRFCELAEDDQVFIQQSIESNLLLQDVC